MKSSLNSKPRTLSIFKTVIKAPFLNLSDYRKPYSFRIKFYIKTLSYPETGRRRELEEKRWGALLQGT